MNFLSRYPGGTNIVTLQTGKRRKKAKNTARNKTAALHKYMPGRPIVKFTTANKTSIRSCFD